MSQAGAGADTGMRIGVFAHRLAHPHPTGIGRYLRELVCAIEQLVCAPDSLILASTGEAQRATWIPDDVQRRTVAWPRRSVQLAWCLGAGPRLERAVGSLDVLHMIQPFPPLRTRARQVATVHDLFPFEHPDWYRPSERWTYGRSLALLTQRAFRLVVPSMYVAERLASRFDIDPRRISVVEQGVTGAFRAPQTEKSLAAACARFGVSPGRFAVCVGAVSTRKNVITLVRSATLLAAEGIPLVVVGPDGHGASDVDAEIARLDGKARALRTGYLPDVEAAALVQAAGVLVHPTLGEGFGFVPLEAMAARTPVIAARISSVPEVVGDAAILVDEPMNPRAWADAITEVVHDDRLRAELTASGERRAAHFSWQRTAKAMLDIYRDAAPA